ncbi:hypothetical protein SAMN05421504_102820 [Amycolatopsis xylanica]|uniref:Uncharacterized protein n=1 Tax=Amycolatopsis xylanica TaxID=589385 RepID=A0A1H3A7N0_9PSEU|nr:hypothetical protein SAMN05421504_102820 [Amycolatopsis xylanica]
MIEFIGRMEMAFIATAGAAGDTEPARQLVVNRFLRCRKHISRLVEASAERGDYFGVRSERCSEKKASTLLHASSADAS